MMRIRQERLPYGVALVTLTGLAFAGWTSLRPASAQDDPPKPEFQRPFPSGPTQIAAGGEFVYILRGDTLFKMKASDLSLVSQKDLPVPGAPPAAKDAGGVGNPPPPR
jgi:hypothetical protein